MRIAFAGWWTGWHVFPIQSLIKYINTIKHKQHEFFWFGEKPSLEYSTYKKLADIVSKLYFIPIVSGKRRREKELQAVGKNIFDLIKIGGGFFQSLWWLVYYKIDVVFCKWWYVSLPVVIAAWILRKKIVLHESDTTPGLSNRLCSKFSWIIFTWFTWVFPEKEIVVGQILDDDLVNLHFKPQNSELYNGKTNVLVTGGSQGSESVYKVLVEILSVKAFPHTYFHIIMGTKNSHLQFMFSSLHHVKVYDFIDQKYMWWLLHLCDVAITRWGTTSLAEQQLFGIKKIIIPIPWTHDQYKNALYYKNNFEDILIQQDNDDFKTTLKKELSALETYKKWLYNNPLESIQWTKDTIISAILWQ